MDSRRNVRANLRGRIVLRGTDSSGIPFRIEGRGVDFSRAGLGLVLDSDAVSPGSVVDLELPGKLQSSAVVHWTSPGAAPGKTRIGVKLINPRAGLTVRLAACLLLALAVLAQFSLARGRGSARGGSCTVSLERMKTILEESLRPLVLLTESDKAFVHIQHQHMSCQEYTRLFEQSDFYREARKRQAVAVWHREIYHSGNEGVRNSAVTDLEPALGGAQ